MNDYRNTEVNQRWARSLLFFVMHSAGLTYTATREDLTNLFVATMYFLGLVLTTVWIIANWRTTKWINYWQAKLAAFEQAGPTPAEIGIFSGPEWTKMVSYPIKFDSMILVVIGIIAALWTILLIEAFH